MQCNVALRNLALVCLVVPLVMVLFRLISSAYTSGDDGYTYMAAMADHGWITATWDMVKFQGRFYQLFVYPLAMLPFQFDKVLVVNLFKVVTFLFFLSGFAFFTSRLLSFAQTLGIVALFLCLFDTVGGSYNAFHGLPLWFGVGCGALLFSLGFHLTYLKTAKINAKVGTLVFFIIALLSYEILLLYLPLFVLLSAFKKTVFQGASVPKQIFDNIIYGMKSAWWLILACFIYLVVYYTFKSFFPGTYVGAQSLSIGTFTNTMRPIWEFSVSSVNFYNAIKGDQSFSIFSLIYAFCCVTAILISLKMSQKESPAAVSLSPLMLLIILVYVFVPNVLFGLTQRYRTWAGDGVEVYLGSLYSAVFISILLYLFLKIIVTFNKKIHTTVLLCLVYFSLVGAGYKNSKQAENFYEQSNNMSVRWDLASIMADKIKSSNPSIKPTINLCSDGFLRNDELERYFRNPDMIADALVYWNRYLSSHSLSPVSVSRLSKDPLPEATASCDATIVLRYLSDYYKFNYNGQVYEGKLSDLRTLPNLVTFH